MDHRADIGQVIDTLRNANRQHRGCSLLIGAGCSVKADIPAASGFLKLIEDRFPNKSKRAKSRSYPEYMSLLSEGERRDLIGDVIDKARINWAHIAIAQLMKHGYVDRILTTNFDPLIPRACAMVNVFPATYDLAASQYFKPDQIPDQAVFYLHGQRTGFVLLNTREECEAHSTRLAPVFEDAARGRTWIVVGYSGESDPVFNHLANVPRFSYNLYWVGYRDSEPAPHVREKLLQDDKDAFFIQGYDADSFFIKLAQELKCFPPNFIDKPFTHLDDCLSLLTPYPIGDQTGEVDIANKTRQLIRSCIDQYEQPTSAAPQPPQSPPIAPETLTAFRDLMSGELQKTIPDQPNKPAGVSLPRAEPYAWAYITQGNQLVDVAKQKTGEEADTLFERACAAYQAALKIKPDMHEALNNWGNALSDQAKTKSPPQSDELYAQAFAKYEAVLKIKPNLHEALNNWGAALLEQSRTRSAQEADNLLAEAEKKLLGAERLSPGFVAYNLACIAARRGQPDACREWLEKSRQAGKLPSPSLLRTDPDLQSMRTHPWFADFLAN